MTYYKEFTYCGACPCQNYDGDYGESCNLGYTIKDRLHPDERGVFVAVSDDCRLVSVTTQDGVIVPQKIMARLNKPV